LSEEEHKSSSSDEESSDRNYHRSRRHRRGSSDRYDRGRRSVKVKMPSLEGPLVPYKAFMEMQRDNLSSEEA
jgi:hypothetical protein